MGQPTPLMLKLALPNKGRLSDPATDLLKRAGFHLDFDHERKLMATSTEGDLKVIFARAHDIPEFVADGVADGGMTGLDCVREAAMDVEELLPLGFGSCRLMLALPESQPYEGVDELKDGLRIATSFPTITREWFKRHGKTIDLVTVSGATEITPHLGVADAVVDLVSTGSTMAMNNLAPVETILDSQAYLIANKQSLADEVQGKRIEELTWVLESVLEARRSRYLMANVPSDQIETVRDMLPGISAPTVIDLLDQEDMVAMHAVVPEGDVFGIVRALKSLGATGILVTSIERLVP